MYTIRGADEKEYGPVAADQLRNWIRQRRANAQTLGRTESDVDWKPLSGFPDFAQDLIDAAPTSPATAAPSLAANHPQPPSKPRTHPLAITSLVLGILSFTCCGLAGIVFAVLALVLGGLSLAQIKKSIHPIGGRRMALAGVVLGGVGLIASTAMTIWLFSGGREWLMEQLQR